MKIHVLKALRSPATRVPKPICPGVLSSTECSWGNIGLKLWTGEKTRNCWLRFSDCCFHDTEVPSICVPVTSQWVEERLVTPYTYPACAVAFCWGRYFTKGSTVCVLGTTLALKDIFHLILPTRWGNCPGRCVCLEPLCPAPLGPACLLAWCQGHAQLGAAGNLLRKQSKRNTDASGRVWAWGWGGQGKGWASDKECFLKWKRKCWLRMERKGSSFLFLVLALWKEEL